MTSYSVTQMDAASTREAAGDLGGVNDGSILDLFGG